MGRCNEAKCLATFIVVRCNEAKCLAMFIVVRCNQASCLATFIGVLAFRTLCCRIVRVNLPALISVTNYQGRAHKRSVMHRQGQKSVY